MLVSAEPISYAGRGQYLCEALHKLRSDLFAQIRLFFERSKMSFSIKPVSSNLNADELSTRMGTAISALRHIRYGQRCPYYIVHYFSHPCLRHIPSPTGISI